MHLSNPTSDGKLGAGIRIRPRREPSEESPRRYVPILWRVFVTNALVLATMGVITILRLSPRSLSTPLGVVRELPVLTGALAVMLLVNLLLIRRTVAPLEQLRALMRQVDLLRPGQRITLDRRSRSEATELAEGFNDMLQRLETEREESTRRALAAQESERLRVAQELHDEIGQGLTAVLLQLGRTRKHAPAEIVEDLDQTQDTIRANLEEVRRIAHALRPEALDELGLVSALAGLTERLADSTTLRVTRTLERDLPPLGYEQELVIYRVAQEALTNVVRHSLAGHAAISLTAEANRVRLCVADDGLGIASDLAPDGGILGMYERALLVDGDLAVEQRPGGGTQVQLDVPVAEGTPW